VTALLTALGLAAAAGFNAWAVLLLSSGLYRLLPQEFPGSAAALLGSAANCYFWDSGLHATVVKVFDTAADTKIVVNE